VSHSIVFAAALITVACTGGAPEASTPSVPAPPVAEDPMSEKPPSPSAKPPVVAAKPPGPGLTPTARYRRAVEVQGRAAESITFDDRDAFAGFQYVFHDDRQDRSLVSADAVVSLRSGAGWHTLLSAGTTADVAEAVVWMKGKASLSTPTGPGPDAEVVPPEVLTLSDGTRRLTMYLGEPPSFTPVLLTVTAPPNGDASLVWGGTRAGETLVELEIQGLVTDLRTGEPSVRATALESLAKIPDDAATAAIAHGLADAVPDMRSRTIDLLEGRGGDGAVTALVDRLPVDPDPFIRIEIINALDELATPAAKAAIAKAATDDADETVRAVAASK
jgi:hypothetical protein